MAVYGVKGVWYALAEKDTDGTVKGYKGAKKLGKITEYTLEGNNPDSNPLYADNMIAENDISGASGGTLTATVTTVPMEAYQDLFGMKVEDVTLTSEDDESISESVQGKVLKFTGNEAAATIGLGLIQFEQVDGKRDKFYAIIFREGTAQMPDLTAATMGESIDWQTREVTFNIAGRDAKNNPWYYYAEFPSEVAATAYINKTFKAASEAA